MLVAFNNYLALSVLLSKLKDDQLSLRRLRTVFDGGLVDLPALLTASSQTPEAVAILPPGAPFHRVVAAVVGDSDDEGALLQRLDPDRAKPESCTRLLAKTVRKLLPGSEQTQESQNFVASCAVGWDTKMQQVEAIELASSK